MYPTLQAVPNVGLTQSQADVLATLLLFSKVMQPTLDQCDESVPAQMDLPIMQIMRGRLSAASVCMSPALNIFLESLCEGIPGRAVLWAYTVASWCHANNAKGMSLQNWMDTYSECVPDEAEYARCWDGQKTKEGNALDIAENWIFV